MSADWTIETYAAHNDALRQADREFQIERDRRYSDLAEANAAALKAALAAVDKASEKTETALKEYKAGANEWRDTVKDLVSRMITRPDVERELKLIDARITEMRMYQDRRTGKSEGISTLWGIILGGAALVSLLIAILSFAWNTPRTPPQPPQILYVPAAPGTLIPSAPPTTPTN